MAVTELRDISRNINWHKESLLLLMALSSVILVLIEELVSLETSTVKIIDIYDAAVAVVFMIDFILLLRRSQQKQYFIRHNWYLLLACIPIATTWAEALRSVRVLRFVRLIRAGEHIDMASKAAMHKVKKHL